MSNKEYNSVVTYHCEYDWHGYENSGSGRTTYTSQDLDEVIRFVRDEEYRIDKKS
jgi:hypothetical protein